MDCDAAALDLFDVTEIRSIIHQNKEFEPKTRLFLDGLLKDLDYLIEMKRLEAGIGEKNFHIVTISGLTIPIICRLENEHKTVLELWAPVAYVDSLSNRTPLHRAISSNDLRSVRMYLSENLESANAQDELGWTPLHCAASREDKFLVRFTPLLFLYSHSSFLYPFPLLPLSSFLFPSLLPLLPLSSPSPSSLLPLSSPPFFFPSIFVSSFISPSFLFPAFFPSPFFS